MVGVTGPRVTAALLLMLTAVAIAVGVVGVREADSGGVAGWFLATLLAGLPSVVVGTVIAQRQRASVVGPLLCAVGTVIIAVGGTDAYGDAVVSGADLPVSNVAVSLSMGAWMWLYVPAALLLLSFPDGRLPSRRWRPVAGGVVAVPIAFMLLAATAPGTYPEPWSAYPHALGTLGSWVFPVVYGLLPVFGGLLIASAVSVRGRFKTADTRLRAQLLWFVIGGLSVPVTLLLCWTSYLVLGGPDLVGIGLLVMCIALPAAIALAMLRHDLFDVDRAATTALTYTATTAGLLGVWTFVSFVGGTLGGNRSPTTAAAATAACAVALDPLRRRARARVTRRLQPLRARAIAAIDDLRRRARDGDAQPEQLQQVLRDAVGDATMVVGYRMPGSDALVDAAGQALGRSSGASDVMVTVPVLSGGVPIGELRTGPGFPGLATEIADAASLLVELVRLRLRLNAALADVEASRARLLHASYAERRKLEADLHDGAQQRLVSLGMTLRLAQRHLEDGTVDIDALLDTSVAELSTSVAELRQLAHGLRPSSLDDGLGPALTNLTAGLRHVSDDIEVNLDVAVDAASAGLPDDVTTTAFFVASEALANAVKHAEADQLDIRVAYDDDMVRVRVADNGRGGAAVRPGSGLDRLNDRVAALGGRLSVSSPAASGTVVEAVLPCAS